MMTRFFRRCCHAALVALAACNSSSPSSPDATLGLDSPGLVDVPGPRTEAQALDRRAGDAPLPLPPPPHAWFESERVQAHTRLNIGTYRTLAQSGQAEAFLDALRDLGATVHTRWIKGAAEGAWWPSQVGAVEPEGAASVNLAKQIIDRAHKNGQRIIAYYRHLEDDWAAVIHPDWLARSPTGLPVPAGRGDYHCFNSPYADFVLTRLKELVALGVDGFYFDENHQPADGCWCDRCKAKFKQETGLAMPTKVDTADPLWNKLRDFKNATIVRTFTRWASELHQLKPSLVLLVSASRWPNTASGEPGTSALLQVVDSTKTEFQIGDTVQEGGAASPEFQFPVPTGTTYQPLERDVKLGLGYDLARDAAGGKPPHAWFYTANTAAVTKNRLHFGMAGLLAHGAIANLDVTEAILLNHLTAIPKPAPEAAFALYRDAFLLGKKLSSYLGDQRPARWMAIHFSETARDKHAAAPAQAWVQVLYPLYGAYRTLLRQRLPVGIVTDQQMNAAGLSPYRVLFLPTPEDQLPAAMAKAVQSFEAAGGLVIRQQSAWKWHLAASFATTAQAFLKDLQQKVQAAGIEPYYSVTGGTDKLQAVAFESSSSKRRVIAIANDYSWITTGSSPNPPTTPAPPALQGVRLTLRSPLPSRVFVVTDANPTEVALPIQTDAAGASFVALPAIPALALVGMDS